MPGYIFHLARFLGCIWTIGERKTDNCCTSVKGQYSDPSFSQSYRPHLHEVCVSGLDPGLYPLVVIKMIKDLALCRPGCFTNTTQKVWPVRPLRQNVLLRGRCHTCSVATCRYKMKNNFMAPCTCNLT